MFSSCAIHSPSITTSQPIRNAQITGFAQGSASALYVLGIGGHKKQQVGFEAKKDLILKNKLEKNENFANFNLDVKTSHFILFSISKVTLTADIIKFTDTIPASAISSSYLKEISNVNNSFIENKGTIHLKSGDNVKFGYNETGYIDSFVGKDTVKVGVIRVC